MNFEEFLKPKDADVPEEIPVEEETVPEELDVQKAVVESLAADKAMQDEEIEILKKRLEECERRLAEKSKEVESKCRTLEKTITERDEEIARLRAAFAEVNEKMNNLLTKQFDLQERNPNALALLDRDIDLPDRFPGESRDHVIEVIREARESAEKDGRLRRAQILEGVLVANEPNGMLAKKRAALEKLFSDNINIINGQVIDELQKEGISYKNGEEYLLPSEIVMRNF